MHFHKYARATYLLEVREMVARKSDQHKIEGHPLDAGDILYNYIDDPPQIFCCIDRVEELTCGPAIRAQAVKSQLRLRKD